MLKNEIREKLYKMMEKVYTLSDEQLKYMDFNSLATMTTEMTALSPKDRLNKLVEIAGLKAEIKLMESDEDKEKACNKLKVLNEQLWGKVSDV